MDNVNVRTLLARAREGDRQSAASFIQLALPLIEATVRRRFMMVRDSSFERQEDAVQQVSLWMLEQVSKGGVADIRPDLDVGPWLRAIVNRQVLRFLRDEKTQQRYQLSPITMGQAEVEEALGSGTESNCEDLLLEAEKRRQMAMLLETVYQMLAPRHRECFELYLQGEDSEVIAKRLVMTPNAVYQVRHRILSMLRELRERVEKSPQLTRGR